EVVQVVGVLAFNSEIAQQSEGRDIPASGLNKGGGKLRRVRADGLLRRGRVDIKFTEYGIKERVHFKRVEWGPLASEDPQMGCVLAPHQLVDRPLHPGIGGRPCQRALGKKLLQCWEHDRQADGARMRVQLAQSNALRF